MNASDSPSRPISFTVPVDTYDEKTSGEYLQVPLPDTIEEYGWTASGRTADDRVRCDLCKERDTEGKGRTFNNRTGAANHLRQIHDKSGENITDIYTTPVTDDGKPVPGTANEEEATIVYLDLNEEIIDGHSISYLCGCTDKETRHSIKIRPSEVTGYNRLKYGLSIPSEYTDSISQSPFVQLEPGDTVHVETDLQKEEIRIYTRDEYQTKLQSSQEFPKLSAPTLIYCYGLYDQDGILNIAKGTDFQEQRFELVIFDAEFEPFMKEAARQRKVIYRRKKRELTGRDEARISESQTIICDTEVFEAVNAQRSIPRKRQKMGVIWRYALPSGSIAKQMYPPTTSQKKLDLVVPCEGRFLIGADEGVRSREGDPKLTIMGNIFNLNSRRQDKIGIREGYFNDHQVIDNQWATDLPFEESDDVYRIYIPHVPYSQDYYLRWKFNSEEYISKRVRKSSKNDIRRRDTRLRTKNGNSLYER